MASWQGNYDSAANTPYWVGGSINVEPSSAEAQKLYGNTSANAYIAGETVGVFAVDDNEIQVDGKAAHAGWILRTTGQGGRAGRVIEETLSVVASFRSDNNADDATYPDASIIISTQPISTTVYANTANANVATFSVVTTSKPTGAAVTYQWQMNTADGSLGWTNVLNGAGTQRGNTTFSGNTTSTLSVAPANTSANLLVFRVVAQVTPTGTGATAVSVMSSNAQITIL